MEGGKVKPASTGSKTIDYLYGQLWFAVLLAVDNTVGIENRDGQPLFVNVESINIKTGECISEKVLL